MLGSIGFDLCPVKSDMAQLNKPSFLAQSESLHKKVGKGFEVPLPEITYGVMVGMSVCRNHSEGNVLDSFLLDLTGTGDPCAVSVEKKGSHHPGFVRGLSPAIALVGGIYF